MIDLQDTYAQVVELRRQVQECLALLDWVPDEEDTALD